MPRPTNTRFAVAVHVLAYLGSAGRGRAVSSEELAGSTATNSVHVRRVLGPLREAGLVRSRPGVAGGWELARPPDEIGLDEVWLVLQGEDPVLGLHGPSPACPVGQGVRSALVALDGGVADAVRRHLAEVTVVDVLADAGLDALTASAGPAATALRPRPPTAAGAAGAGPPRR